MRRVCGLLFVILFAAGAARGQGMSQPEGVRALFNAVGSLSAAAVLAAVRSAETGQFTLAGRAIPFTLASAGIFAALQWGYDQAKIAAGSPIDIWNNSGRCEIGYNAAINNINSNTQAQTIIFYREAGNSNNIFSTFWVVSNSSGQPLNDAQFQAQLDIDRPAFGGAAYPSGPWTANGSMGATTYRFCKQSSKPSLADWIAGTYPGGVPHPEVIPQIKQLVGEKLVADNPQSSNDAGFGIFPSITDSEWHAGIVGCASGSFWDNNVKACVNVTCESGQLLNPETNACGTPPVCPAGSRRVGSSWACTPNPTCPAGSSFDTSTNQCRPDEAPCTSGQVRDPLTRQCRPPDGCPTGQIRNAGGTCEPVQCPAGQILDPVTNLCSDGKPTDLPPTPFDQLLAKIGAAITRVVALGSNKIPFGLASYFPSFSAGSGCDVLDITMNLGATLGNVTLPICSNPAVTLWHTTIRPILLGVFTVLGALWIIRSGLQS